VTVPEPAVPEWLPSHEDVRRHIPTRGPFTYESHPSRQQVEELTLSVARGLQLELGESRTYTPMQAAVARSYVEHATAARVEWGWFPEQQDVDGAGAQQERWATVDLNRLRTALGLVVSPGSDGGGGGPAPTPPAPAPRGWFPPPPSHYGHVLPGGQLWFG
jgi:hypothetical protein